MNKSFAIVGAGAVGSYYGARLAQAGHDVRFLLRADYEAVKKNGLTIESTDGDFKLPTVTCKQTPEEIGPVDVVIIAWKTTANSYFKETISPLLHKDTLIVTLQNGLGNVETLAEIFGPQNILGALCFVCINRIEPGLIRHTGGGMIAMGEFSAGLTPRLEELAELFNAANFPCRAMPDLQEAQWRKLVWNIPFNGLCITEGGIDTEELLLRPGGEERVRELMAEVIAAAVALGHEIETQFINDQVERTRPMEKYRPSSMIDYVEDRPVEVDAIWGEPLRRARAAGAEIPVLAALYEEIKQRCE